MRIALLLAFAAIGFTLAAASAPAGSVIENGICGLAINIQDPGLRESFARFDRSQSSAAARICAVHRSDMSITIASR
jgi:hypothetical protein